MSATPQWVDFTCVLDTDRWGPMERIARAEARTARLAQGLPARITDAGVYRFMASMVRGRQSVTHSLTVVGIVVTLLAAWGTTLIFVK